MAAWDPKILVKLSIATQPGNLTGNLTQPGNFAGIYMLDNYTQLLWWQLYSVIMKKTL